MNEKVSTFKEKNEYERIKNDYSNNYGYNIGINSYTTKDIPDLKDNSVNELLNTKKR